jgi:hypothetical protein
VQTAAKHAFGGLPATQETLIGYAAEAKPIFDASLAKIIQQAEGLTADNLLLAALKGSTEQSVNKDSQLVRLIFRVAQKAHAKEDGEITLDGSSSFDGSALTAEQTSRLKIGSTPLTTTTVMNGLLGVNDVVRATIKCLTSQQMEAVIQAVLSSDKWKVVKLKNSKYS